VLSSVALGVGTFTVSALVTFVAMRAVFLRLVQEPNRDSSII
jgi:hypothetical protein